MAKKRIIGLDEESFRRVREATRRVLGRPTTGAQRRRQAPVMSGGAGGGSGGANAPEFRITVTGHPTVGSFDLNLQLPDESEALVSDAIEINWDMIREELETAIQGHSEWNGDDYAVEVADGPFPVDSLSFKLGGTLSDKSIPLPTVSNITLSGGTLVGVRVERINCECEEE